MEMREKVSLIAKIRAIESVPRIRFKVTSFLFCSYLCLSVDSSNLCCCCFVFLVCWLDRNIRSWLAWGNVIGRGKPLWGFFWRIKFMIKTKINKYAFYFLFLIRSDIKEVSLDKMLTCNCVWFKLVM